jgi:hypothetical protein
MLKRIHFHTGTGSSAALRLIGLAAISLIIGSLVAACDSPSPRDPKSIAEQVARQQVADFLSVPVTDTTLVSVAAQEFNDSSLDCPEPGMSYLQVLTPGYRVIIEADGRRFDVRVSGDFGRICRRTKPQNPNAVTKSTSPAPELIDLARQNLADAFDADASKILVLGARPLESKPSLAGCEVRCQKEAPQCGYVIELSLDGRRFFFHGDAAGVKACPPILTM